MVRAPDQASAGKMLDDDVLTSLANLADELPFVPEIQIRANRVAAYLGERNATVETAKDLQALLDLATAVAGVS